MSLCIVGNCYELGNLVRFDKYDDVWTINGGFLKYPSTLNFDLHDWVNSEYRPDYYEDIKISNVKNVILKRNDDIKNYELYPISDVKKIFPNVFSFSLAYILAYAFIKKYNNIYLCGMNFDYYYKKDPSFIACLYYMIGFIIGNNIEIDFQVNFLNFKDYGYDLKWNNSIPETFKRREYEKD